MTSSFPGRAGNKTLCKAIAQLASHLGGGALPTCVDTALNKKLNTICHFSSTMITSGSKIISRQEKICTTIFSQALGLMFQRRRNLLMVFPKERRVHLHTWFVFYPLTVVLLDKNYTVVEVKGNLLPFHFWSSQKSGKYLLELANPQAIPAGGDKVKVKMKSRD